MEHLIVIVFGGAFVLLLPWITRHLEFLRPIRRRIGVYEPPTSKETTVDVYQHGNLPSFRWVISRTAAEIWFLGITLEGILQRTPQLQEILSNKRVRILLLEPDPDQIPRYERLVNMNNIEGAIQRTISDLRDMRTSLSEAQRRNLEIKKHNQLAAYSNIIIDPYTENGFMQVEPYPYHISRGDRRNFMIYNRKDGALFRTFRDGFNNLWAVAEQI